MAGRILEEDVSAVRERADLAEVAAQFMQLKRAGGGRFKALCPFHAEKTPSFTIDASKGLFHCLAGETGVVTWDGTYPIQKLAGSTHRLLTEHGYWVDAPIMSFGEQRLMAVHMTRNHRRKTIYATDGHRWLLRGARIGSPAPVRFTKDLRAGDRLAYSYPNTSNLKRTGPSPFGIAHGFTFGDGTRQPTGCVAQFAGEKDRELLKFFPESKIWDSDGIPKIGRLPLFFKDFPSLNETPAYLYGWLVGYFAADGCVSTDGQVVMSSASSEALEFVRTVANRLGIGTYGIKKQRRKGYGLEETDLFHVTFINSTLTPEFFALRRHRDRFQSTPKERRERKGWVVEGVEETERYEEVFCAIVEGTHSFTLEDNILTGNCFGCGKGGNVFSLVMELESLSFPEAVERLAAQVGVTLRYENVSPQEREATGRRLRMVAAHKDAVEFFHESLLSKDGLAARDYLKSRDFKKPTAVEFRIGYSPKARDALVDYLKGKGHAAGVLVDAGLARKTSEGLVDVFRNRVMFPIFDLSGEPVAFGARILEGNGPKYLNTAETPIWHKGRVLYAMHRAKANVVKENAVILVEGYTDVIALHQAGVRTAVASCGTALGLEHFKLLRRFTDRAILAYDADQAGQAAAARAFEEAFGFSQETGIDTRVIELPAGSDPADFVAASGGEAFAAMAAAAMPVVEYRLRRELDSGRFDLTEAEGRDRAMKVTLPILRQVKDEVVRRDYARRLAGRLHVDEDLVVLGADPGVSQTAVTRAALKRVSASVKLEREALKLALQYPDLIEPFVDRVSEEDFSVKAHRSIWMELRKGSDPAALPNDLDDANARRAVAALAIEEIPGEVNERLAEEIVSRLKEFAISRQIDLLKTRLQALNPLKQPTEYKSLFEDLLALEGRRREMVDQGGGNV